MPLHMLRSLLVLALALGLASCDSASDADLGEFSIALTLAGEPDRTLSAPTPNGGNAYIGQGRYPGGSDLVFRIELDAFGADDGGDLVLSWADGPDTPALGDYTLVDYREVAEDGLPEGSAVVADVRLETDEPDLSLRVTSGTVTVESTGEAVAGRLEFVAQRENADGGAVSGTGTFRAVARP